MSIERPTKSPEKNTGVSDNDRKFVVDAISPEFLASHVQDSYFMVTDWLETNEDDETKIVHKVYDNEKEEEFLHIAKVGDDTNRKSKKTPLSETKYQEYRNNLTAGNPQVKKHRYEFEFEQNGMTFVAKYDKYADGLQVLEIDAKSKKEEDRNAFDPDLFDFALVEVTGIKRFYGYRIASLLRK